jgi:hypothetical protein
MKKTLLLILLFGAGVWLYFQKSKMENYLDGYVRSALKEKSGGMVVYDKLYIGLGRIKLTGVRLIIPDAPFTANVKYLNFKYNLWNFFTDDFTLPAILENVIIKDGELAVKIKKWQNAYTAPGRQNPVEKSIRDRLLLIWDKYGKNQSVTLDNFNILADFGPEGVKPLVRKLDGKVNLGKDTISLQLDGGLLYSEDRNVDLNGVITRDSIVAFLNWRDIELSGNWPFKRIERLSVSEGIFDGSYKLSMDWFVPGEFSVEGKSRIDNLTFTYREIPFSGLNFRFTTINDKWLQVIYDGNIFDNFISGVARLNNLSPLNGNGALKIKLDDISSLSDYLKIPLGAGNGEFTAFFEYNGDKFKWKTAGKVKNPLMWGLEGDSLALNVSGDFSELKVDSVSVNIAGSRVEGKGSYLLDTGKGFFDVKVDGVLPENAGPLTLSARDYSLYLNLELKGIENIKGEFGGKLEGGGERKLLGGTAEYSNKHLSIVFSGDSTRAVYGEVAYWKPLLGKPYFRADLAFPGSFFRSFDDRFPLWPGKILLKLEGADKNYTFDFTGLMDEQRYLNINGDYKGIGEGYRFLGTTNLHFDDMILDGPIDWTKSGDGSVSGHMELANSVFFDYSGTKKERKGKLRVEDFSLSSFGKLISSSLEEARINWDFKFEESYGELFADSRFAADKILINGVGYYGLSVAAQLKDSLLRVDSLLVFLNNKPYMRGRGESDLKNGDYNLEAGGNEIDFEYLSDTFLPENMVNTGKLGYNLSFSRRDSGSPLLALNLNLVNGRLAEIPVDSLIFEASFLRENSGWRINIDRFIWRHKGDINLSASGIIPLNDRDEIQLGIDFQGDPLKYLHLADDFFVFGESDALLNMELSGTYSHPRLGSLHLDLKNGVLGMRSVIDRIENLSLRVRKEKDSSFVAIKKLYGEIENGWVEIHSVPKADTKNIKFENWKFDDLGLDFGVLELSTSKNGVPLKIFGPMEDGESGRLKLSGRDGEKYFYFAGPVGAPLARGTGTISDIAFVYPFLEREGGDDSPTPAQIFLSAVRWNVIAQPAGDVRYTNEVKAYLDDVILDLAVNPAKSGLKIDGALDDGTFTLDGKLISNSGTIDYLDLNFRVEEFGVLFNRNKKQPELYGKAVTTVRDSVESFPRDVYLKLVSRDPKTGGDKTGGEFKAVRFKLETSMPLPGETEDDILAYLGYSGRNIQRKAIAVGGRVADKLIFRPLVRPIESNLEKWLNLDVVRIDAVFTKNIFSVSNQYRLDLIPGNNDIYRGQLNGFNVFNSSRITVGKFLMQNLYLTYTGQLVSGFEGSDIGITHKFGFEYRFLNDFLFEFEYDLNKKDFRYIYYPGAYNDFRFRIRHSFNF